MSRLKEFHDLEDALKIQLAQLEILRNEDELIAEREFEKKLTSLMKRYDKQYDDVIALLQWHLSATDHTVHESQADYAASNKAKAKKSVIKR
jgi:uncharacterized protein YutD